MKKKIKISKKLLKELKKPIDFKIEVGTCPRCDFLNEVGLEDYKFLNKKYHY